MTNPLLYRGIVLSEFIPSAPPSIEEIREIKICELCTRRFLRSIHVEKDSDGIDRFVGPVTCDSCGSLDWTRRQVNQRDIQATKEIQSSFKQHIQKYRVIGAEHVVKGHKRTSKWAAWREPLIKAFKKSGQMTSREIGDICGAHYPGFIENIKHIMPIVRVGFLPPPNKRGRGLALYSLNAN